MKWSIWYVNLIGSFLFTKKSVGVDSSPPQEKSQFAFDHIHITIVSPSLSIFLSHQRHTQNFRRFNLFVAWKKLLFGCILVSQTWWQIYRSVCAFSNSPCLYVTHSRMPLLRQPWGIEFLSCLFSDHFLTVILFICGGFLNRNELIFSPCSAASHFIVIAGALHALIYVTFLVFFALHVRLLFLLFCWTSVFPGTKNEAISLNISEEGVVENEYEHNAEIKIWIRWLFT